MNCPYCKKEMSKGRIWSSQGMHFQSDNESFPLCKHSFLEGLKAGGAYVESYFCPQCKRIITPLD